MARDISVSIAVNGEREFSRALKEAQSAVEVLDSELKASEAAYANSGDAQAHLAQRLSILNSQLRQQDVIVGALGQAVEDSAKEFGDAARQTDRYRIALNEATARAERMKTAIAEANREADEMGRDSARIGRQMEQGIGEAAEDVGNKFDTMVNKLDADVSGIGKTLNIAAGFSIAGNVLEGLKSGYDAVTGFVDSTMDYNRTLSFLKVNAEAAGYEFEKIEKYAISVAGITGDMDAAVEGMSNLLKTGLEADEMAMAVARLSGAIIELPDTMKFESLAESFLESISTGSAVGQYAEYLQKMGLEIETVNEALGEAKKTGQEAVESTALALLSGHGAEETLAKWKEDNKDLVDYYTAQAELTKAQAELAQVLTPLATETVTLATDLVEKATEMIKTAILLFNKETWEENESVQKAREENLPEWDNGYITGAEEAGEKAGEEYINGVKKTIIEEAPKMPTTWEDFGTGGPGYDTGTEGKTGGRWWDRLFNKEDAKESAKTAVNDGMSAAMTSLDENAAIAEEAGEKAGEEYINGVKKTIIEEAPKMPTTWEDFGTGGPGYDTGTEENAGGSWWDRLFNKEDAKESAKTAVNDGMSAAMTSLDENAAIAEANANVIGGNIGTEVGNGIASQIDYVASRAAEVYDAAAAMLNRPIAGPTITMGGTSYASAGGNTRIGVDINIDGRSLSRSTSEYTSSEFARATARAETYG